MRVLLVNDLAPSAGGGTETYVGRLAEALAAAGDDVELLAGAVAHRGAGRVLDVYDPWARRLVARTARAFGADVVHHHNVIRELSVAVLGAPRELPCVLTVHDHRLVGAADPRADKVRALVDRLVKRPLDRAVARHRVDTAVAVSGSIARGLRAARFSNVVELPAPIPEPVTVPRPVADCRDVVFAGRLGADKGLPELLAAWERVRPAHPASNLVVAGDGPLAEGLSGRAQVIAVGRLDRPALSALLGGARMVAVPSRTDVRREGLPLIALEAAAHGRPLVASDDGDELTDITLGRGVGLATPPGDVAALAEALETVLSDDDVATRFSAAGVALASVHSYAAVAQAHRGLYTAVLAGRALPAAAGGARA